MFILIVVDKDGNRSFILLGFFKGAEGLTHGLISLAVGVIFGIRLNEAGIYGGCFGNAIHDEGNMAILLFLLAGHVFVSVKLLLDKFHD